MCKKAVKLAGGPSALAKELSHICKVKGIKRKISRQAIDQWSLIPAFWVPFIEDLTGISKHAMRPDLFPPD